MSSGGHGSATDRRLNALFRHLSSSARMDPQQLNSIAASPTSANQNDSVFSHVVRAPEDPILGVRTSLSSPSVVIK